MIDLNLGTKATLRFHNAHDEEQAIEMLRSAYPGLVRGIVHRVTEKNEWLEYDYSTPQIQLIEK